MLRSTFSRYIFRNISVRKIHISPVTKLKEYVVDKKGNTTVIDAKFVESPRKPYLLNIKSNNSKCPLCELQLDLKYTDVLILSQYLNSKGQILLKEQTKLCADQYKLVKELIHMAQHAGLLPKPETLLLDKPYQKLNTYYDERTIKLRRKFKLHELRLHHLKLSPIEKLRVKPHLGTNVRK